MTTEDVATSYASWWQDAGLHSATALTAHGWRTPAPAAIEQRAPAVAPAPQPAAAQPVLQSIAPPPAARQAATARPMPADLPGFFQWLAEDPSQPEAQWTGRVFLPPAAVSARLLVLTDMPDDEAEDAAMPFAPVRGAFVAALLGSIGVSMADAALAPLAYRRPPGGLLDEAASDHLATRMRHYLALVRPKALLLLGDRTSRALLGTQGGAQGRLAELVLDGTSLIAAPLASPEHLMRRPSAKAASWQTLRLLSGALAA